MMKKFIGLSVLIILTAPIPGNAESNQKENLYDLTYCASFYSLLSEDLSSDPDYQQKVLAHSDAFYKEAVRLSSESEVTSEAKVIREKIHGDIWESLENIKQEGAKCNEVAQRNGLLPE